MLRVPKLRQPDSISCLPTCIHSALIYLYGEAAPAYEEVVEACRLDLRGAVDELAFYGLQQCEWEVRVLLDPSPAAIRDEIEDDRPVIVLLDRGVALGQMMAHAVLACGVTDSGLFVMDPEVGEYVEILLFDDAGFIDGAVVRGFVIAGSSGAS